MHSSVSSNCFNRQTPGHTPQGQHADSRWEGASFVDIKGVLCVTLCNCEATLGCFGDKSSKQKW